MKEYQYQKNDKWAAVKRRRGLVMRMQQAKNLIDQEEQEEQDRKQVSPKLEIGEPNDKYEQEADDVAKKVVSDGDASTTMQKNNASPQINMKEEEDGTLMAKSEGGTLSGTEKLQTTLDSSKGSGQALDNKTQSELGGKMGADLSDVKIHTDSKAHEMSEGINAKAFTHGQDIYFKQGNFDTSSTEGKELLVHELAHTQQQKNGVNRKIQRTVYVPKKVADDYFANVQNYSFKQLQKQFGSDRSGPQNMKLQDLLSAIIYMNKDLMSPQQVWDQILKDPTRLRGYDAFFRLTTNDKKLPGYSRTAGTVTPVVETPQDVSPQATATVDYAMSKNFLVSKKKREAKRKAANDLATGFIHGSAGKLQSILDESQKDKEELQQKVQALLTDVNNKLNTEGATKAQTVTDKIAQAKVNAQAAKKQIIHNYYLSLGRIVNNTKIQQKKLDDYLYDAQEKIAQLKSDQQAVIDVLYKDFKTKVSNLLPGFTQTVRDKGRKRYESHTSGMFTTSLDEAKGRSAVRAALGAESDLNNLSVKTIDQATGEAKTKEGDRETKKDYEAQLEDSSFVANFDLLDIHSQTQGQLNDKADLDKKAAGILKDDYVNHIDEITLVTIQYLTDVLELHYTQLDEFGAKQDAAIDQLYSESVLKLTSGSKTQINQVQQLLDIFADGQKPLKTPKLKKLQESISESEGKVSPLIIQASEATQKQHAGNLQAMDALSTLVFTEFDEMTQKNTTAINTLVLNAETNYAATQKEGVDKQSQLRADHLRAIVSDVDTAKSRMQMEIDGFYENNQLQLEEIRLNLAQRLADFEMKANEIIAGLDKKMDDAERQTEKDFYSGKLARDQNIKDFRGLSIKLYGTEACYKDLKKIMDDTGYSDYEQFYNSLESGSLIGFHSSQEEKVKALDEKVKVQGFAGGTLEFVNTIIAFEKAFRFAASAMALQYVKDYRKMLLEAQNKLGNQKARKDLFDALATFRNSALSKEGHEVAYQTMDQTTRANGSDNITSTGLPDGKTKRTEAQQKTYDMHVAGAKSMAGVARNDLRALYSLYPVLNDEDNIPDGIDKHRLARAEDAETTALVIQEYITRRLSDASDSIGRITSDEGTEDVYKMNKAIPAILLAFSLTLDTFPGSIIQDKIDAKRREDLAWAIITFIFLIVLTIISGPLGASLGVSLLTAELAGLAITVVSVGLAIESINEFARGTDLAKMNLASTPSFLWVVFAVVGAGLSIAPLLKTVSTVRNLNIALLDLDAIGTSKLPAFRSLITGMIDSGELTPQIGNIILTKLDSRMGFLAAVDEYNAASKVVTAGTTGNLFLPLSRMAFFKFREGMSTFEEWLAVVRNANRARVINPGELVVYKQAYTAGMEGLETAAPQLANQTLLLGAKTAILQEGSLASLTPVVPTGGGFINMQKFTNAMEVSTTGNAGLQVLVDGVLTNGDQSGALTEQIEEIIFNDSGFLPQDGKVGSNQGFDYIGIKGSVENPTEILIGDAKPWNSGVKLSPGNSNTGLQLQLSDDWVQNVAQRLRNAGKTQLANMVINNPGIITKYVVVVNKTTGKINILKLGSY